MQPWCWLFGKRAEIARGKADEMSATVASTIFDLLGPDGATNPFWEVDQGIST